MVQPLRLLSGVGAVVLLLSSCAFPQMEVRHDSTVAGGAGTSVTVTSSGSHDQPNGAQAGAADLPSTSAGGNTVLASNPGGASSTAGAPASTASKGVCRDEFEALAVVNGASICVAKMTRILGPAGTGDYDIDVSEVTRSQYDAWLATNPALLPKTDAICGWNSTFSASPNCMAGTSVCKTACAAQPVVCLDWCDAYAYGSSVGKRLCGKIGGGRNAFADHASGEQSQWYRACSSGLANSYPYGSTFDAAACNGIESWNGGSATTVAAGIRTACRSNVDGYSGAFDMSGNVLEWEDSCASTTESGSCRLRGGAFDDYRASTTCEYAFSYARNVAQAQIGFRCCS